MTKYQDRFRLNVHDIDLIESTIRKEISRYSKMELDDGQLEPREMRAGVDAIRELHELLGKIANQKVFYAQVNATGVPAG